MFYSIHLQPRVYSPFAVWQLLSSQISSGCMFEKTRTGLVFWRWYRVPPTSQGHLHDALSAPAATARGFLREFQQSNLSPNSYSNSKWALPSPSLADLNSNCDAAHAHDANPRFAQGFSGVSRMQTHSSFWKKDKDIHTMHVWRRCERIRGDVCEMAAEALPSVGPAQIERSNMQKHSRPAICHSFTSWSISGMRTDMKNDTSYSSLSTRAHGWG